MSNKYYIASCMFTWKLPATSIKIQNYIKAAFPDIKIIRCCLTNYRVKENTARIDDEAARTVWQNLPPFAEFAADDVAYSLCHNCTNIISEQHEKTTPLSLWELIDTDKNFAFPDYGGQKMTVQDCWRSREYADEQNAVRSLLKKMNIECIELAENRGNTDFCGSTLYRPQPAKNARFAPKHYVEQAAGKFLPHTEEEQLAIMKKYCERFGGGKVVCYCHYCLEGLLQGEADAKHIAELLFP